MNDKIKKIREAVHDWYQQEFAHANGWGMNISQNDVGEDVFTGLYGYKVEVHLHAAITEDSYTVYDSVTNEKITFGVDDFGEIVHNHSTFDDEPIFESELMGDLYDQFIELVDDPEYDVYDKYFRPLPDGTHEFIGGE